MGLRIVLYIVETGEIAGTVNWDGMTVTFNDDEAFDIVFGIVMSEEGQYLRPSDGAAFVAALVPYWSRSSTYHAVAEHT